MNYKLLEKIYLRKQKQKILNFATELFNIWEITKKTLQDTYFFCNIAKNK